MFYIIPAIVGQNIYSGFNVYKVVWLDFGSVVLLMKESPIKTRDIVKLAALPLLILLSLVIFIIVYRLLGLPPSMALVDIARKSLDEYGYPIAFAAAFIETIPPVNLYFPGSVVIVVAVSHSRTGALNPFLVLGLIEAAFIICYSLNYLVGRFGLHWFLVRCGLGPAIERSKLRISQRGMFWLWISCWHPNFGAIASVASGILSVPFIRFFSNMAFAVVLWNALFGSIAYFGSKNIMKLLDLRWLLVVVLLWIVWIIVKGMKSTKRN